MDEDRDLPLHDEAAARTKWRGGETIVEKGDRQDLPASEVDAAAPSGRSSDPDAPRVDLRPPD